MRYQWERCPNPDVNLLHITERLPEFLSEVVGVPWDDLDEEDRGFFKDLCDVPGVVSIISNRYTCQIEKGRLFEWEAIRPQVIEVFRKRFRPHGQMIEESAL